MSPDSEEDEWGRSVFPLVFCQRFPGLYEAKSDALN